MWWSVGMIGRTRDGDGVGWSGTLVRSAGRVSWRRRSVLGTRGRGSKLCGGFFQSWKVDEEVKKRTFFSFLFLSLLPLMLMLWTSSSWLEWRSSPDRREGETRRWVGWRKTLLQSPCWKRCTLGYAQHRNSRSNNQNRDHKHNQAITWRHINQSLVRATVPTSTPKSNLDFTPSPITCIIPAFLS